MPYFSLHFYLTSERSSGGIPKKSIRGEVFGRDNLRTDY